MTLRLKSISTSAGFLKNALIEFSEGMTCIIGARGTCKSTVVESIRFAFDCDGSRINELTAEVRQSESPSSRGLIRATLQNGVVKCTATHEMHEGEHTVSIERELGAESRLYRSGIEELADRSLLSCIEIYSQGDLQRIADDEKLRLDLIDRPNKQELDKLRAEREVLFNKLSLLGPKIRSISIDAESRRADIRFLDNLYAQLATVKAERPQLSAELDKEREGANARSRDLDAATAWLEERNRVLQKLEVLVNSSRLPELPTTLPELDRDAATILYSESNRFSQSLSDLKRFVEASSPEVAAAVAAIRDQCSVKNQRYFALRQEQQEVNDSLKKEDSLKVQIQHLEKLRDELHGFENEVLALMEERRGHRRRLSEISERFFTLRQSEVEEINSKHHASIVLALEQGSRSPDYAKKVYSLLQGSRLRGQDEVAAEIASRIPPSDLIDIVEASDVSKLTSLLNRDAGQMTRLIAYLAEQPDLYGLEAIVFEDYLEITMYDQDVPKPIGELSKGQMATALLPLILRDASYPLIFDQPEDDLDNRFIFETLVAQLKNLKTKRQLIFVTHNANIPVLGEADKVVVMEMESPKAARMPMQGSVDDMKEHILRLLEGGIEAFRSRHQRYTSLLK